MIALGFGYACLKNEAFVPNQYSWDQIFVQFL